MLVLRQRVLCHFGNQRFGPFDVAGIKSVLDIGDPPSLSIVTGLFDQPRVRLALLFR
jgi:hypothetical protein